MVYVQASGESNLLAVGLGRHIGDVLVPTVDPQHGYVAGLQCLHRKVLLQTDGHRSACPANHLGIRQECNRNFTSGWVDVCAAYSKDGLRWTSVANESSGPSSTSLHDAETQAPYDPVVPESQSAPPPDGYHRLPHAVVDGPGDSYVQILPTLASSGYIMFVRRNFATAWPLHAMKWRGARGLRILKNDAADLTQSPRKWKVMSEFYLDMQWGEFEVHRRQVYGLTVTQYAQLHIGFMGVLEWARHPVVVCLHALSRAAR